MIYFVFTVSAFALIATGCIVYFARELRALRRMPRAPGAHPYRAPFVDLDTGLGRHAADGDLRERMDRLVERAGEAGAAAERARVLTIVEAVRGSCMDYARPACDAIRKGVEAGR